MLTEEEIAQYKREHGDIVLITTPAASDETQCGELVFKAAPPPVWADFQQSILKEREKGLHGPAFRRLCHACRVYPDERTLEAVFRRYSALATRCANAITDISGQGDEFQVKKL